MGRAVSCQLERDLVDVDCLPIPLQVLDLTLDLAVFFPGHDHIPRLCALEHDALPAPRPEHLFDLVERASVLHGPLFLSLDDELGDRGRHFFIVVGLHRETAPPLGHRAEPGRIAEHFGEGNLGVDHLDQAAVVHGLDRAAFGTHIASYIAQKFCGGDHLHRHDGFENDGLGPSRRLLERHGARDLECRLGGVDLVIGTVVERDLKIGEPVAGDHSLIERFTDAFFNRRNELLRNGAALDGVYELKALTALERTDLEPHMAVLAAAAGLADVFALRLGFAPDGFLVRHLRAADIGLYAELALHALHDDLKMKFAHARNNGLAGLHVTRDPKGRILVGEAVERQAHLLLIGLRLGINAEADDGFREVDFLEDYRGRRIRKRVAGRGVLKAHQRADLPRVDLVYLLAIVRMQAHDAAYPLLLPF